MSKNKTSKKKVVVTTSKKTNKKPSNASTSKKKVKPTVAKSKGKTNIPEKASLTFGKQNYILMGIGIVLVFLGLFFMSGGDMPSPDVWDEGIIYSFRRTVLAPVVLLAGLVVEIFAIFKGYKIDK